MRLLTKDRQEEALFALSSELQWSRERTEEMIQGAAGRYASNVHRLELKAVGIERLLPRYMPAPARARFPLLMYGLGFVVFVLVLPIPFLFRHYLYGSSVTTAELLRREKVSGDPDRSWSQEDYELASYIERHQPLNPSLGTSPVRFAQLLAHSGKVADAKGVLSDWVSARPSDPVAKIALAEFERLYVTPEKSLVTLGEGLNPRAGIVRGTTYYGLGQWQRALGEFNASVSLLRGDERASVEIWSYLTHVRKGDDEGTARQVLEKYYTGLDKHSKEGFYTQVIRFFLDPSAEAFSPEGFPYSIYDLKTECRIEFFQGSKFLIHGKKTEARASFERALATRATACDEYFVAGQELKAAD